MPEAERRRIINRTMKNLKTNNGKLSVDIVHYQKTTDGKILKDEKCVCLRYQDENDIREISIILSKEQALKVINSMKRIINTEN